MEIMFIVFGRDISRVHMTSEISLCKNNSHDLHRVITHLLVLVIVLRIEYPLEGSSKKGSHVHFLLIIAIVVLL